MNTNRTPPSMTHEEMINKSALVSGKHSPSLETLRKYAAAVGKKLEVHLV